ncbi:SH3 domain-containing protein [Trichophyton tonsurans CBS 112818]|uniref:SH3 domain-containing protein n=1 Tax=Trichophyton tonsurans (strain CBS 112818) TaxID=647933 RepID=F2RNV0_TRIT1|nr:SH3 domain-containing protein [Trichophyton tonsurans CBS 112818]
MAPQAPELPTKFPCWCRAVYSWGGESKQDLGFIEGDLIECLNAGDGSWWTGRLRRDRRMVGVFPSNFVKVLEDDFVPATRSVSPLPPVTDSPSNAPLYAPKKEKTIFRKPFQGYKQVLGPSAELAKKNAEKETEAPTVPEPLPRGRKSVINRTPRRKSTSRAHPQALSPAQPPRQPTPLPTRHANSQQPERQPTPQPERQPTPQPERQPTPQPDRQPTPQLALAPMQPPPMMIPAEPREFEPESSPPPPPPPPHRIAVRRQPSYVQPGPSMHDHHYQQANHEFRPASRTPSPYPPSPGTHHRHTPSPLRDAMEDVMSSLQGMSMPHDPHSEPQRIPSPFNPWSPAAFDNLRGPPNQQFAGRPSTSLGLGNSQYSRRGSHFAHKSSESFHDRFQDGPPQLGNYVQRMESRLRQLHNQEEGSDRGNPMLIEDDDNPPPPPPRRGEYNYPPSQQMITRTRGLTYDSGQDTLGRTFTTRSIATNSSSGVQSNTTHSTASTSATNPSLMSGTSAGGFSATSAGSFAKRHQQASQLRHGMFRSFDGTRSGGFTGFGDDAAEEQRPYTPMTSQSGSYPHLPQDDPRQGATSAVGWTEYNKHEESPGIFGGLTTPKSKKTGFLKKMIESAKTGAATARSSIATAQHIRSLSPTKGLLSGGVGSFSPTKDRDTTADTGLGGNDWVQVRRDVNRATSPSRNELVERAERCQMMDYPVIYAVEELYECAEGDEGLDGLPVTEPTNWAAVNLQLVDKSSRFINSLPPMTSPASLAQGFVCRPHRSDVQRLRAIFTWVAEKIVWDEEIEGEVDVRRVIQMKRGSPREVAVLVMEMCDAVGLHAEVVQGYLKTPGEQLEFDGYTHVNHWWNNVLIDGEWRVMDCSLASPTHPRRALYSSFNPQTAETWYFLARPMEICYTHIPLAPEHQHICPPISPDVLLALPCACPAYFKNGLHMPTYDTSLVRLTDLEMLQVRVLVPPDIECIAEVEAIAFARDADGDVFESGDIITKRALAQPDWIQGQKRFTIKAALPGDEGQGVLKVYAGKKGLMHSIKDIPHALAFALPITHTGDNPPYEFVIRHPTPHAQRHDLYVIQPQFARLAINNTFVFAVRQHPSSLPSSPKAEEPSGRVSPSPFARPSSALSMVSSVATISNASTTSSNVSSNYKHQSSREKLAKLAIQTPSGKILRLSRKADHMITTCSSADSGFDGPPDGSVWETVIKVSERGVWRGLVLADRTARWCVWGEWECF